MECQAHQNLLSWWNVCQPAILYSIISLEWNNVSGTIHHCTCSGNVFKIITPRVETVSVTMIPRMDHVSGTITPPVVKIVSVYLGVESLQYTGLLYRGMESVS